MLEFDLLKSLTILHELVFIIFFIIVHVYMNFIIDIDFFLQNFIGPFLRQHVFVRHGILKNKHGCTLNQTDSCYE